MSFDLQAERTLVLTLVARPRAFDYTGGQLEREMFADPLASRIFHAVQLLVFRGTPINPVSVQAAMLEDERAGSVIPTWNRGNVVTPEESAALASRVREMWARREIAAASLRLGEIASNQGSRAALEEMAETLKRLETKPANREKSMLELSIDYLTEAREHALHPSQGIAFDTGYKALDRHTGGLRVGELFVIAARPSNGKTSFVTGIASHLARTGIKAGAFWLEDDWHDAVRRYHQTRNYLTTEDFRDPRKAHERMTDVAGRNPEEQERLFVDDTHGLTIADICARMRRMARERGVRVFFADHLGEIQIERDDRWGDRHDLALGKAARAYRDTAKDLNCVPVLCAQMNRRVESRADRKPQMSDIDGSGQVEQAARAIAFVSQPLDEHGVATGEFIINLEKNMNGPKGEIRLKWVPERMSVENP
jgi:replicative DNA helicase